MTTVSLALAKAGVRLPPLNERIWRTLYDSKLPRNGKTLAQMLNAKPSDVSGALNDMAKRGMVTVEYRVESVKAGKGYARRTVGQYRAVGTEYELLPLPFKQLIPPAPVFVELPKPKVLRSEDIDIESMKLSEARALYRRLQEFFA